MGDPVITPQLLAAAGAGLGALSKPRNPLQGALLGGLAGYTGGTALGLGAPTAASGGGLTMGAGGATGLTSGTGAAINAGANTANAGLYSLGGTGTTAGLSAAPATAANTIGNYSLAANAPVNYSLVAPSAVTSAPSTSFMDKISMSGKNAYENPMMTAQALSATNSLLTPEQMPSAPSVPIQARGQLRPFNPMESMDPYRQSVISNQPISLLG
jgi:hypothetical protein